MKIKILENTIAAKKFAKAGSFLTVPVDCSEADATFLCSIKKAEFCPDEVVALGQPASDEKKSKRKN